MKGFGKDRNGVTDEYDTAQRAHATNATATALETSSDGARVRSEGSLEPKSKAPCNKIEILRLKNNIYPHPNNEQLGFYLLAICSHIVFRAPKPQFEPQNLKFVARETARRDKRGFHDRSRAPQRSQAWQEGARSRRRKAQRHTRRGGAGEHGMTTRQREK